jgi:hypothetical protein
VVVEQAVAAGICSVTTEDQVLQGDAIFVWEETTERVCVGLLGCVNHRDRFLTGTLVPPSSRRQNDKGHLDGWPLHWRSASGRNDHSGHLANDGLLLLAARLANQL